MTATLTIYDETPLGECSGGLSLNFSAATVTIRELIRSRVSEEVRLYNASEPKYFRGLVQPADAERTREGYRLRQRRRLDTEEQCRRALEAFERNGFFVLVDDRQVDSLDDEIELHLDTSVRFVRLLPLVGG